MALRKKNRKWHWRFQVDGRIWSDSTHLEATKPNRPEAQRLETEAREFVMHGQNPKRRLVVRPFTEAADDFLNWAAMEHREHPNTHRRLVTSLVSLKAFFGGCPVGAVSEGGIEDFKTRRRQNGIREVTLRHDLYALSKFFEYSTKQRWAARNPIRNVDIPSDAEAIRMHVLSDAEEKLYFQRAHGDLYDLGRLMLLQGCRPEEVLQLRQSDVDLENRKLRIAGGKTKAARRTLTLTQESMHILARRLANPSQWVFPSRKRPGKPIARLNSQHDAVLFRFNHVKVGEKWVEKSTEAQVQFVLYDLRHTFATRLAERGIDLATIAAILGHSGVRVVMRYVHVTEAHQREAMLRYDAALQEAEKARASFGPVVM